MDNINIQEKVLSPSQRFKLKLNFLRSKNKLLLGKKRMKHRLPSENIISMRARKEFRKKIEGRVRKDKQKKDLSYAERQNLEKIVDKVMKNPAIQQKMINLSKPGGMLYTKIFKNILQKIKDRSSK